MDENNRLSPALTGKTVLITRARAQAAELATELEAFGATIIHCPTIETVPANDLKPLDDAIDKLDEYDWILFTSANAVDFFLKRLREQRTEGIEVLGHQSICAIGSATARALTRNGARVTLTASESVAEGVLNELINYLGGETAVSGLRFLIPRSSLAREVLPSGLRSLGAHVDAVDTYQTILPEVESAAVRRLFEEHPIDVITFTSSSTVSNFAAIVGLEDLSGLLRGTLVACIGPVTARTAAQFGLKQVLMPEVYNAHELVMSIVKAFHQPAGQSS